MTGRELAHLPGLKSLSGVWVPMMSFPSERSNQHRSPKNITGSSKGLTINNIIQVSMKINVRFAFSFFYFALLKKLALYLQGMNKRKLTSAL